MTGHFARFRQPSSGAALKSSAALRSVNVAIFFPSTYASNVLTSISGVSDQKPYQYLSPEELQEYNQRMEQYEKAAREQMEQQKNGSLNTFQQGLKALNLPYEW